MIYEWYSGSDRSGRIPAEIAEIDRHFDELSTDQKLERLQAILACERDRNWRGCLRFRLAMNLKLAERDKEARAEFLRALEEFDPLAGNIRDVMPQYTGALHRMILDHLTIGSNHEKIVEYASILAANMSDSMLDAFETALSYGYLARALNCVGHENKLPLCYRLGLNFAIRAHHAEPDDPIFLEQLVYCYFNVRDAEHCRLAYEMFRQVEPSDELRKRVDEFMRTRFHEIGGTLETPS